MEKYFIGIDLGTGSTKAIAININGEIVATSKNAYPINNIKPGYSEQSPGLIWQAFVKCVSEITSQLNYAPALISLSSAMHSIMPVNKQGTHLADAMLWSDSRSGDIAQQIRDSGDGEDLYRRTGTAIYAMSPLCKLIWLRQNDKQLFNSTYKFISVKEYIWYKIFGVFEIDHSIASATGLFDILELKWYDKACNMAGINSAKLSVPVSTGSIRYLQSPTVLPGVSHETAFVIGASDGCCANLGGNAVRNGVAALTIGTSGAVRVGSSKPVYNYKAMTFNYLLNENTFICGGAVNNGGAAADWLIKDFLNLDITQEAYSKLFSEIDNVEPGSNGLVFLPYLYGERAPVWDAKSSGAFININYTHTRQHFLRAALEGVCLALYSVLNAVEELSDEVKEVVISGGFISSDVWVQLLANVTGKRLVVLQSEDASAIGAIYMGMQALKINTTQIMEKEAKERIVIEPDEQAHETYKAIFPVYKKLYDDLRSSMHQLHNLNT